MATEAWVVPTLDHCKAYLVAAQLVAINTAARAAGQGQTFDDIMPDIVNRVRSMIAACSENVLSSTANSVPASLLTDTCYLILEAMQTRIPTFALSESQKEASRRAWEVMKMVARCDLPVATPDDPAAPTIGTAQAKLLTSRTRQATAERMDGL